jgi:hypothetical protein
VPSIAWVKDFAMSDASLFTGDFDSDRKLLAETISCILVYSNGSLIVELRGASFFTPCRQHSTPVGSEPRPSEISVAKRAARKVAHVSPAGVEPALAT